MEKVYLESSIPSYLINKPNRDVVIAGNQQQTRDWWTSESKNFELYISAVVIQEISAGEPELAQARLEAVQHLPVLPLSDEAVTLAEVYMEKISFLPPRAYQDTVHIALAAVHNMDYLLTWNCKHIANVQVMRWVREINKKMGYPSLWIVTPAELISPTEEDNL